MPPKNVKPLLLLTTVAKKSDAARLAKTLVAERLAACVTILPGGESRYVWKGKLCVERELLLLVKTTADRYGRLERRLKAIHPYECPEILGISCDKVHEPYRRWLETA